MIAILAITIPPLVCVYIRNKILEKKNTWQQNAVSYIFSVLLVNWMALMVVCYGFGKSENLFTTLNTYNSFACKYILLATLIGIIEPIAERLVRKNITINVNISTVQVRIKNSSKIVMVITYAIILAIHYIIRMFDNSIWGDEGLVVRMARFSWNDMLYSAAQNGHSPFHYAFAWGCVKLFGESGFVWHLSAALPYFIILVICITIVRKWFGNMVAVILITLSSLLDSAIGYNMEIRMYVWCELFILLTFLALYKIYLTQKIKYYVLMALFCLMSAYTHYFALASIGIMYCVLFIYAIVKKKNRVIPVILSGGTVLILFMPWLVFVKNIIGGVISNYGLPQVSWNQCVQYIFYSQYSWYLLLGFFIAVIVWFFYQNKILKFEIIEKKRLKISVKFPVEIRLTDEWMWVISGIFAVFGTIAAAQLISHILYPIITLRYLYISYIVIWLLIGVVVSKLNLAKVWTVILVSLVIVSGYPSLTNSIQTELENNSRLEKTLELTQNEIKNDDFIYTDIVHFAWTVSSVYYPDTPNSLFGHVEWWGPEDLSDLDSKTQYWLFMSAPITDSIIANLSEQGKAAELIVDDGYIGTGNVWVYKVNNE